jgi:hypothetical protein
MGSSLFKLPYQWVRHVASLTDLHITDERKHKYDIGHKSDKVRFVLLN